MSSPTDTDIVSLAALHLAATVGPDHWNRARPQPIHLTLHLHLAPFYLDTPARSDDVADSLHYGHLAKAIERRMGARGTAGGYASARALVEDVTDAAFRFARGTDADVETHSADTGTASSDAAPIVRAVRAVLLLPKYILLAGGFEMDVCTRAADWTPGSAVSGSGSVSRVGAIVRVTDLVLPVLIGVNPPERLTKQRVVTHLTFFEAPPPLPRHDAGSDGTRRAVEEIDYATVVQHVVTAISRSAHLTLEKLVYEIVRTAYRAVDAHAHAHLGTVGASRVDAITARCEKPSALSFADASGVEMTRTCEALRRFDGAPG